MVQIAGYPFSGNFVKETPSFLEFKPAVLG
jgi:hypothetical protein